MQILCSLVAALLISFAWLSPFHTYPWVTFSSELASFGAALALLGVLLKQNIKIPKPQLLMLPLLLIPVFQWLFGLVPDFSVALLSFSYVFMFWLMMIGGYNLSSTSQNRERSMQGLSYVVLSVAFISSLIAIVQWLNLESNFSWVIQLKATAHMQFWSTQ
jgi:hypothetical protein